MSRGKIIGSSLGGLAILTVAFGFYFAQTAVSDYACNVNGYTLYGELVTSTAYSGSEYTGTLSYSEDLVTGLVESNDAEHIKAVLIEIDSLGGQPVAAEEIANALKRSEKPTVALIRTAGTSAAYWAASGADAIFASRNSDVGAIGVIVSLLDESEKNREEGIGYISITSAPYKDLGTSYREPSADEKKLIQRDVDAIHESFVTTISENRKIPLPEVEKLADGSSVLGGQALEMGLIDNIGDQYDAEQYLSELIGEEVRICWPHNEALEVLY